MSVMCCPRLLKVYLHMTELSVVRLPFNSTEWTFMNTANFKVRLKSCTNRGASEGGLYTLSAATRENCQLLPWKCQQEFLERLEMYRCVTSKTALMQTLNDLHTMFRETCAKLRDVMLIKKMLFHCMPDYRPLYRYQHFNERPWLN